MMNTEKRIQEIIVASIDREQNYIDAHKCLHGILLAKWQGKKLNKRLADQFRTEFFGGDTAPGVAFGRRYGMAYLDVWACPQWPDYSKRLSLFLGYDHEPGNPDLKGADISNYDASYFGRVDCSHGPAAEERNNKRRKIKPEHVQKAADLIDTIKDAWGKLKKMVEYGTLFEPDCFSIVKLTGLTEDREA
jgi:hypothetical protein